MIEETDDKLVVSTYVDRSLAKMPETRAFSLSFLNVNSSLSNALTVAKRGPNVSGMTTGCIRSCLSSSSFFEEILYGLH